MKFNSALYNKVNAIVPWGDKIPVIKGSSDKDIEMADNVSTLPSFEEGEKSLPTVDTRVSRVFQRKDTDKDRNERNSPVPAKAYKRRMSTTSMLAEIRRSKKEGVKLNDGVIRKLELVSRRFRERNGDLSRFQQDFNISKLKGAKKFKGASKLIIQNDRMARHAEEILSREGVEAKINEIVIKQREQNENMLPGQVTTDEIMESIESSPNTTDPNNVEDAKAEDYNDADEKDGDNDGEDGDDGDGPDDPFEVPDGALNKLTWAITRPIEFFLFFTVPRCAEEKWKEVSRQKEKRSD